MITYQDLQDIHQQLLTRREAGEDRLALRQAVVEYIEQARREAGSIARPRDRDQLRANLRFWATYLYDETGTYPDTALLPANQSTPPEESVRPTKPWSEKVDLPGPIDPPRWVLGLGVTIILLLVVMLIFLLPQSATPPGANKTQEHLAGIQNTQISVVSTAMSQPTETPVDWEVVINSIPTSEALPATDTLTPVSTPNATQTMSALRTQAAQIPTDATPTPTFLPETGGGDKAYLRPALLATIEAIPNPDGCRAASVQVQFNLGLDALSTETPREGIQAFTPQDFTVIISPLNETLRRVAPLSVNADGFVQNAASIAANTSYLVQLADAPITASDVIVQFDATCQQSYVITYSWQERPSLLPQEPTYDERLTLAWKVLAWGPVPQIAPTHDSPWFSTLNLSASGGDGTYLFWLYSYGSFEPLTGNEVTLYSDDCLPVNAVLGVTSGGLTVVREIVLLAPLCQAQTPPTQPVVSVCGPQAKVQQNALCRTGPSTVYDVLTSYDVGQLLTSEGRTDDASWLWVLMPDSQRHCWVSAALLTPPCDVGALPVIEAPPTPVGASAPTETPTPTATATPTPTATNPPPG
jgi:hypothetical protein